MTTDENMNSEHIKGKFLDEFWKKEFLKQRMVNLSWPLQKFAS